MASDQTAELIWALDQITMILRGSNEHHWVTWLEKDRKLIANGDFYGVEHLLQAFGGMGSFNDFGLGDPDKDSRIDALRGSIYDLAVALKKVRDRA
ncbi:MAG: hypothetical protein KF771_12285 [Burkholderiales bacterium]|nr:hypothetical protein [Burkholderiales bacterium]